MQRKKKTKKKEIFGHVFDFLSSYFSSLLCYSQPGDNNNADNVVVIVAAVVIVGWQFIAARTIINNNSFECSKFDFVI